MAEATAEPSLDRFFDHSPRSMSEGEYISLLKALRMKRAQFLAKEAKRKSGEDDPEADASTNEETTE